MLLKKEHKFHSPVYIALYDLKVKLLFIEVKDEYGGTSNK